ncbi:complement component 1 Q subcomponent-binding protein, mitochondrial isoform X2 [Aethina tumida]|uniref:complement component 1 Q subcomponent-binding protein, mitochondrial isoform X2 n=1 Tax=Aethina tumida TaxID=116153 RepID=UPI00214999BE|nr:complement component 1 Q subcomponent-binding protein, mitochondrial isoform X2 [Aethina tumida]
MNNILKATLRVNGLRSLLNPARQVVYSANFQQRLLTRNLWYMCGSRDGIRTFSENKHSNLCSCGCNMTKHGVHSKGERELVEFLTEEILAEKKAQKVKTIPTELDGFAASLNGAEVTLTKQCGDETVKIKFNINHTVDTEAEPELHENLDKPEIGELKSKPSFDVELIRNKTTVSIRCSFIGPNEQDEGYNDIFGIDEISIYDGEWNENTYAVSGEVIDSYLYDLLLNYLEEKGISNEFVEKLSQYSTAYEHTAYIGLLEGLSKFVSGK